MTISFVFFQTHGQKLNRTYYLLGTLSDYMGRHYPKYNPTQWNYVMTLHKSNLAEIKRIEAVTHKKFIQRKHKKDCKNCHEFYNINSVWTAWRLNRFYSFKRNKGYRDKAGFAFYTGALTCDKLTNSTEDKQLSFIAGLFLTSGTFKDGLYKISLANSPWRFECAKILLNKFGAEIVCEKVFSDYMPAGYIIEFKASDKVKTVLENEIKEKDLYHNTTK